LREFARTKDCTVAQLALAWVCWPRARTSCRSQAPSAVSDSQRT
jgi:hypothetical protein